jgi:hypothetical protein
MRFSSDENEMRRGRTAGPKPESEPRGRTQIDMATSTRLVHTDTFLWASLLSMAASAALHFGGNKPASQFVGQWAPTLLILGVYNKLVKQLGSDSLDSSIKA